MFYHLFSVYMYAAPRRFCSRSRCRPCNAPLRFHMCFFCRDCTRDCRRYKYGVRYRCLLTIAALTVFFISIAIVIGPTPPGTGVIAPATFSALSNSTSPHNFPSSMRLIPTSITTAPSLIISPLIKFGIPTAATSISACFVFSIRFFVLE